MKPFCVMPFVRAFVLPNGQYRNCCAVNPEIVSDNQDFDHWWNTNHRFNEFKEQFQYEQFPPECQNCAIQERTGASMRTSINKLNPIVNPAYPREWSINFGSACNLACWTCNENYSSKIQKHKEHAGLLDVTFSNPNTEFKSHWDNLKNNILKSYNYHDDVTICIQGGEPAYNPLVLQFVDFLLTEGYSTRTKLEITTNGTKNIRLFEILKQAWKEIHVFISVDAVGERASWIRYDSNWLEVTSSIDQYIMCANYVELHTTLSILNIQDLPEVVAYAQGKGVNHTIIPLIEPDYMSLMSWDGPNLNLDTSQYQGLESYLDLIGKSPKPGSYQKLIHYINAFGNQRRPKPLDQKF